MTKSKSKSDLHIISDIQPFLSCATAIRLCNQMRTKWELQSRPFLSGIHVMPSPSPSSKAINYVAINGHITLICQDNNASIAGQWPKDNVIIRLPSNQWPRPGVKTNGKKIHIMANNEQNTFEIFDSDSTSTDESITYRHTTNLKENPIGHCPDIYKAVANYIERPNLKPENLMCGIYQSAYIEIAAIIAKQRYKKDGRLAITSIQNNDDDSEPSLMLSINFMHPAPRGDSSNNIDPVLDKTIYMFIMPVLPAGSGQGEPGYWKKSTVERCCTLPDLIGEIIGDKDDKDNNEQNESVEHHKIKKEKKQKKQKQKKQKKQKQKKHKKEKKHAKNI